MIAPFALALVTAPLLTASSVVAGAPIAQDERPTADRLIADGWRLVPAYDGEHRWFLTEGQRRETVAAAHLFAAAVELEPAHMLGLWRLAHAEALLAEDDRNRGRGDEASVRSARALEALNRAVPLDPSDPWVFYARGIEHAASGDPDRGVPDLERAVSNANARAAESGDAASQAWIRFKALEWLAECLMRAGRFDAARVALEVFHDEFSDNAWPKHIALAGSHLRQRDFAGARAEYDATLAGFPDDPQAYALLGYLEGLLGDRVRAAKRLEECLQRQLQPDVYVRLWAVLLAPDATRAAARGELASFVASPPSSISEWDRRLGAFVLGQEDPDAFLQRARAEEARRMSAAEPVDDLLCEAWYYVGEHHQLAGRLALAADAYAAALRFRPVAWKWEWAFARLRFAEVARAQQLRARATFELADGRFESSDVSGTIARLRWHVPQALRPLEALGRPPEPGDLLQVRLRLADGSYRFQREVVGAD